MTWKPDLRKIRRSLGRNLLLKAFSLVFALGLWAFVNLGTRDSERTLSIPVELRNVSPEVAVTGQVVEEIDVRIRGPRTILGTIDERRMKVPLNLANVGPGEISFKIDPERLGLPRGVTVMRLSPAEVNFRVERVVTRRVPVELAPGTAVPDGYRLVTMAIRPPIVSVTGPESDLRELKEVSTAPLGLRTAASDFEEPVSIEAPSARTRVIPDRVMVRGRLEEIVVSRELKQVELGVRNGGDEPVRLKPDRGDVTLRGPQRILDTFRATPENFFVDVAGVEKGTHRLPVETQLPEGVRVSKLEPEAVMVEIGPQPPASRR